MKKPPQYIAAAFVFAFGGIKFLIKAFSLE